jgi:hypothetical protein
MTSGTRGGTRPSAVLRRGAEHTPERVASPQLDAVGTFNGTRRNTTTPTSGTFLLPKGRNVPVPFPGQAGSPRGYPILGPAPGTHDPGVTTFLSWKISDRTSRKASHDRADPLPDTGATPVRSSQNGREGRRGDRRNADRTNRGCACCNARRPRARRPERSASRDGVDVGAVVGPWGGAGTRERVQGASCVDGRLEGLGTSASGPHRSFATPSSGSARFVEVARLTRARQGSPRVAATPARNQPSPTRLR